MLCKLLVRSSFCNDQKITDLTSIVTEYLAKLEGEKIQHQKVVSLAEQDTSHALLKAHMMRCKDENTHRKWQKKWELSQKKKKTLFPGPQKNDFESEFQFLMTSNRSRRERAQTLRYSAGEGK